MLNDTLPRKPAELVVPPQEQEVVLTDDSADPLSLVLPPSDDLAVIDLMKGPHLSVRELVEDHEVLREEAFRDELVRAEARRSQFQDSPVYLNRLANLARAAGDLEAEGRYLSEARGLSSEVFFANRYGENLLSRGDTNAAEAVFASSASGNDVAAILRLAAICVRRRDLSQAMTLVKRAADIDPVDFGVRLFEGGLHLAAGAYEMAIHCFRLAAAERPTSSVVAQNLAVAYLRLGATEKSFLELKKAVSLNPINEAALFLLADLAHSKKRDADVIPHLRYYLQFEQGSGPGWARLARACIEVKDLESALTALRQQASISDTSRVWNNIGVVRSLQNDGKRAAEAFKYAMGRASSSDDRDARLAARNFAQLLMSVGLFDELERYVGRLISADTSGVYRRDEVLSDVYVFYFFALRMRRKSREIEELAESVLAQRDSAPQLAAWVLGSMVGYYALYDRGSDKAVSLIAKRISTIEPQLKVTGSLRTMLFNNVAFAYAEAGRISEAEYYLVKIQGALHREPYPTATLGLIDFKKGNVDRGLRRYREAVSLARTQLDKARIRQKLELEFGRFLISVSESRARRHLQRAATFRGGDEATAEQANHELKTLAGSK